MTVTGPRFQPVRLDLQKTRELRIQWADGAETAVPLAALRGACPCATCRALREERQRKSEGKYRNGRAASLHLRGNSAISANLAPPRS